MPAVDHDNRHIGVRTIYVDVVLASGTQVSHNRAHLCAAVDLLIMPVHRKRVTDQALAIATLVTTFAPASEEPMAAEVRHRSCCHRWRC